MVSSGLRGNVERGPTAIAKPSQTEDYAGLRVTRTLVGRLRKRPPEHSEVALDLCSPFRLSFTIAGLSAPGSPLLIGGLSPNLPSDTGVGFDLVPPTVPYNPGLAGRGGSFGRDPVLAELAAPRCVLVLRKLGDNARHGTFGDPGGRVPWMMLLHVPRDPEVRQLLIIRAEEVRAIPAPHATTLEPLA